MSQTSNFINNSAAVESGSVAIGNTQFGYTRQNIADLGNSRYTLAHIAGDESPSVGHFIREIEGAIRDSVIGLQSSSRAGQIMLSTTAFSDVIREVHGFVELPLIDAHQYINSFHPNGDTAIEDAAITGLRSIGNFGADLHGQDFKVNAIQIIITDGKSNSGQFVNAGPKAIAAAKSDIISAEKVESIFTLLIGVNVPKGGTLNTYLQGLKDDGDFDAYISLADANPDTIKKIVGIVVKSVSSSSASLGSGVAPAAASLSF